MKISKVELQEDGSTIATVTDDDGNIVGFNVYTPESSPIPEVDKPSVRERLNDWLGWEE